MVIKDLDISNLQSLSQWKRNKEMLNRNLQFYQKLTTSKYSYEGLDLIINYIHRNLFDQPTYI